MIIKKPSKLYSIKFPIKRTIENDIFQRPDKYKSIYFATLEEANLYRDKYHPNDHVVEHLADCNEDNAGNKIWTLLIDTKQFFNPGTPLSTYKASPELIKAINENPDSIIVVRETGVDRGGSSTYYGSYRTWEDHELTAHPAEEVSEYTRLLYVVSSSTYSYLKLGDEVKLTSAQDLVDVKRKEDAIKLAVQRKIDDKARLFQLREKVVDIAKEIKTLEAEVEKDATPAVRS